MPEIKNDVSVVETISTIEDDPTFASVLSISSVLPTTSQISSYEDVPLGDLSHEK